MWYNSEVNMYGNPAYTWENWGHFSQVVWDATTHIGCAMQTCKDANGNANLANVGSNIPPIFTVCNYKTPGNVAGEYTTNVKKSLDQPTILGTLGL